MKNSKYMIVGAVVVVGLLVAYFAISGFPPGEKVAGTIAGGDDDIAGVEAAERYRADAITDADVSLDDQTINDLLQDPEVVAVLRDEDFQNALTAGALDDAYRQANFMNMLREGILTDALRKDPEFGKALMENNLQVYLSRKNMLIPADQLDKLRTVFEDKLVQNALANRSLRNFLANAPTTKLDLSLAHALDKNASFRSAINDGVLKSALKDENFRILIGNTMRY